MADSAARVQAISSIRDFRGRLVQFTDLVREALSEAQFDIRRTMDWLQHDQRAHWQREIKSCNKKLETAKSELFRAELNAQQSGASTRDERQAVVKLQRRIEHAEKKLQAVQRWIKLLDREMNIYRGHVNGLSSAVSAELPAACEQLNMMAAQLDRYVATTMPSAGTTTSTEEDPAEDTANDKDASGDETS